MFKDTTDESPAFEPLTKENEQAVCRSHPIAYKQKRMTDSGKPLSQHEILLYTTPDGTVRVDVTFEDETFWLTQKRMAELFGVESNTITYHLREIFKSLELEEFELLEKFE